MNRYLLDTCVIIDYLRDRNEAVEFIRENAVQPGVSVVTVAELYAGVRGTSEQRRIEGLLTRLDVCEVDADIGRLGGLYCRQYSRSHGVEIPDALIAATAELEGLRLVTRNARHFPMLGDVLVPYS